MFFCLADAAETAEDNALVATCLADSPARRRDILTASLLTSLDSSSSRRIIGGEMSYERLRA
jgi:hypothetical protein